MYKEKNEDPELNYLIQDLSDIVVDFENSKNSTYYNETIFRISHIRSENDTFGIDDGINIVNRDIFEIYEVNLKKWFKLTYIINMSRNYYNMHKFTKFRIKFIEI